MGRSRLIRKLSRPKGGSYYITLPKVLLEALGWKVGDDIKIELEGNHLILRKVGDNNDS